MMMTDDIRKAFPMASFASLPAATQAAIRDKQRQRKLAKRQEKARRRAQSLTAAATVATAAAAAGGFPTTITQDAYFGAAPGGLFRHPNVRANLRGIDTLLRALAQEAPGQGLASCNYFMFTGSEDDQWDPVLNARLAWEGFFTITHGARTGRAVPLPELQPFYSVLLWANFERSKYVRSELSRLRRRHMSEGSGGAATAAAATTAGGSNEPNQSRYRLVDRINPERTWRMLNRYHTAKHGSNWLTKSYFEMMVLMDSHPGVNFTMHCIELYDDGTSVEGRENSSGGEGEGEGEGEGDLPLSGEIGFTIGRVYTSLSGWTEERSAEGTGTAQLVLLGRWLQAHGYSFWSLGHCYSPEMDYKRQLGHRIFPRSDFRNLLAQHRGPFRPEEDAAGTAGGSGGGDTFAAISSGETVSAGALIVAAWDVPTSVPAAPQMPKAEASNGSGDSGAGRKDTGMSGAARRKSGLKKKAKPNEPCPCGSGKKFKKCCR